MQKSIFLKVLPFVFMALMVFCLWLGYFGFAASFLVCTMVMVFIEYGIYLKQNQS